MAPPPVVDIHTHLYPPPYLTLLSSRTSIPLVRTFPSSPHPRLILLETELPALELALRDPSAPLPGRPLTPAFTSIGEKLSFMAVHGITTSVMSLANPWLDFLGPAEAAAMAREVDGAFEEMCAAQKGKDRKLYFFAAPPLTAGIPALLEYLSELAGKYKHCRGIILGTSGLGLGLDDTSLLPIFHKLAALNLPVFLHPHYGLPPSVFGPRAETGEYGHVLPLALGFPMETTVAVARMYLAGVFDAVPALRMILAHSGGTLPFLAGRIESCVRHDGKLMGSGKKRGRTVWEVLREQVYLDAVVYSEVGLRAAVEASGVERLMFGTDHPFFPPVGEEEGAEVWDSVKLNVEAVEKALGKGSEEAGMVMGGNAARVLRLFDEEE
ncbi:hypothetical protein C8A05DRAFT_48039 [Staphylotrichum tortipilum]|uniref:Amidohydrolase-related domain-containing protein n=1 Tax=Staphylotrichum tortipilum TaxID=2831512 RepID=A0AAN6RN31_9PEZI|nr:hypothetical protein C8A05DRAFT_48039 [Staphylotrichum longicolle]